MAPSTKKTAKGALADLARPGAELSVRVTPRAGRAAVSADERGLRVAVTEAPEGGKATRAVQKALARALGVAPSRLTLVRGETARLKVFRLD